MIQKILETPNSILKQKSKPIEKIDASIFKLAESLIETQKANFGLGLAAPQIGVLKRMIVYKQPKNQEIKEEIPLTILVNPEIVSFSKEIKILEEACLSLPGISGEVTRAEKIEVKAIKLDLKNKSYSNVKFKTKGLHARIIQHEADHLDGILLTDRVDDITTIKKVPIPYKIVFAGTPEFSSIILENLIKNGWGISLVVTEPDRPAGRGKRLTSPPVKKFAQKKDLLVYRPEKISNLKSQILNLKPDLIIVASYGQIIPKEIFEIPLRKTICLHPSLLPKYRGSSPIQTAILNGDKETGVTIFQVNEKIDAGGIIANGKWQMANSITAGELTKQLAKISAKLLTETLPDYLEGKIKLKKQDEKKASWTKKITKENGYIEKSEFQVARHQSLEKIERKIRAYYPWPKVWTKIDDKRIIIHKAHIENSKFILDIVQPEGKRPAKYEEYLKGNPKIV